MNIFRLINLHKLVSFNNKGNAFVPENREEGEERITVTGHVLDTNCNHIPCVEIEVWGTDLTGGYR